MNAGTEWKLLTYAFGRQLRKKAYAARFPPFSSVREAPKSRSIFSLGPLGREALQKSPAGGKPAAVSMRIKLEQYNDWDVVAITGAMMMTKLSHVPPIFEVLSDKPGARVALDLSKTQAMDSGALSVLLNLKKRLHMNGGCLVVVAPTEEIRVLFGIVGFDERLRVFDTRREFEEHTHRVRR